MIINFINKMPAVGLEPTIPLGRWCLKPLRIPFRHTGDLGLIYRGLFILFFFQFFYYVLDDK